MSIVLKRVALAATSFVVFTGCSSRQVSRGPAAAAPHAATAASSGNSEIDALAKPLVDGEWTDSLVVALVRGSSAEIHGYGKPVPDGKTIFEIGSATKVFTSLALATMVEDGEVSLEDPVEGLLPATVHVPAHGGKKITLLTLSDQTSGLPRMPSNFHPKNEANPYVDYAAADLYAFLSGYSLTRDPGVQYDYSNVGVGLLGHAIALRAKTTYPQLIADRIAKPLAMTSTTAGPGSADDARRVAGHLTDGSAQAPWDFDVLAAAGSMQSDADDMARFVEANLGTIDVPPALAKSIRMTHEVRAPRPGGRIALGWHLGFDGASDDEARWHNGQTGGFHSFVAFDVGKKVGVVVLANSPTMAVDKLGIAALRMLRGEPHAFDVPAFVHVPESAIDRLTGRYQLSPGFVIAVTRDGDRTFAQATAQPKFRIYPSSATEFKFRDVDASLTFEVPATGAATRLVLHQNGRDLPGPRVD